MAQCPPSVRQQLLSSCVKFSQTVVLKKSFRNLETGAEMERLICRAFQCEIDLNYINVSVSRLLLVPVAKGL